MLAKVEEMVSIQQVMTFAALREEGLASVPATPGVYAVFAAGDPAFAEVSCGGHFKGKDPTVPVATLRGEWVPGSDVLYIGKANVLNRRLREFAAFGAGRPIGHWGGRYIWQLEGCQDLMVGWVATPEEDPRIVEGRLLESFVAEHGGFPFANLSR
jgi:hypothetical protein